MDWILDVIYNFKPFMPLLFTHEGGYVNHPRDPGGETKYGISKRSYPRENIKAMTKERATEIYKRDFWDRIKGDQLPSGVDIVVFDAAVNSGSVQAVKWLQREVDVSADGIVGPATLAAVQAADARAVVEGYSNRRMAFLRGLKTWPSFGRGWTARVESVRRSGLLAVEDARPDHWLVALIKRMFKL